MKAFHEAGGRYVLAVETTPGVFDSIAENLTKANAERIVAIEAALESSLRVFRGWLHDIDPYNELGNDNIDRAAAVNMIQLCSKALKNELETPKSH